MHFYSPISDITFAIAIAHPFGASPSNLEISGANTGPGREHPGQCSNNFTLSPVIINPG
jgi:hypothetical protein